MERADVVIGGGGTGGHVYPGLAVADVLRARRPGLRIVWVGTARGIEARAVPAAGYPFVAVPSRGLKRRLSWETVAAVGAAGRGLMAAWRLLGALRPRVVLGTGGYAAAPVAAAAIARRIPLVLQEQNAYPGLTNRIFGRFAWRIALGSPAAARFFGGPPRAVVTGNPIRPGIASMPAKEGARRLGLDPSRPMVMFMAGSLGARSINDAFVEGSHRLRARSDLDFMVSTGNAQYEGVCARLAERWGPPDEEPGPYRRWGNVRVWPYVDDMAAAYAAASLVVARAGAMSLAELTARGVPAVLVPYPYAAEGHQEHNARELEAQGAAVVVPDGECRARLIDVALALVDDSDLLARMAAASAGAGRPDAARDVAALLEEWLEDR